MRPCSATPTSTFRPHRPCSPSHLSGAPSRSHGGLCHPEPSPGDRPEAPRGSPPRQLSWGGASGRGRGPSQVTGQAGPGGGGELHSRTKGRGDPRDGSGGGVQRMGPGEAAAPGCAPQRRKPGTAPSLCVGPRFGGTAAPLSPLSLTRTDSSGRLHPPRPPQAGFPRSPREPGGAGPGEASLRGVEACGSQTRISLRLRPPAPSVPLGLTAP